MRKFNVVVNGQSFEVEVDEIGAPAPKAAAPTPRPAAPAPAAPSAKPAAGGGGAAGAITAPLPGSIIDVRVSAGQAVKAGDVLCILEAMKMENEITATAAGTVKEVLVSKGSTVAAGDSLVVIG